jgi:hypothetical protein
VAVANHQPWGCRFCAPVTAPASMDNEGFGRGGFRGSLTQLKHLLSYASRFESPLTRKAGFRLAGLYREGVEPSGPRRKLSGHMIFPLSWHPDATIVPPKTGPPLIALRLSLLPAYPLRDQVCLHPSCSARQHGPSALCRSRLLGGAPPLKQPVLLYPRSPRSSPGYAVPDHHHLTGPLRPARKHITISPRSGLYAMPSRCGSA